MHCFWVLEARKTKFWIQKKWVKIIFSEVIFFISRIYIILPAQEVNWGWSIDVWERKKRNVLIDGSLGGIKLFLLEVHQWIGTHRFLFSLKGTKSNLVVSNPMSTLHLINTYCKKVIQNKERTGFEYHRHYWRTIWPITWKEESHYPHRHSYRCDTDTDMIKVTGWWREKYYGPEYTLRWFSLRHSYLHIHTYIQAHVYTSSIPS